MNAKNVVVVGAGTMGAGIAQVAAGAGCDVTLIDVSMEAVRRGIDGIGSQLSRLVEKGKMSAAHREAILGRIVASDRIEEPREADLAIEAVVEEMGIKSRVFQSLAKATPAACVLATNTSSLSVTKIAECVDAPERVVGMHFFNPAPLMPLVEIIAGEKSAEAALTTATETAKAWGKVTVRAKDSPGFIVNRVARGFYLESLRMLGEGVAGVAVIDGAMCTLGGFKMGPFQLMDLIGIDVNYAVSCSVYEQSVRPERLKPHDIQRELVAKGHLGRKTGRGFYQYESEPPKVDGSWSGKGLTLTSAMTDASDKFASKAALCVAEALAKSSTVERYAFARVLATIMNEAALALDEGVATAYDIDIAMQKGTNYPKGPLQWADSVGAADVGALLRCLSAQTESQRFDSAPLFA